MYSLAVFFPFQSNCVTMRPRHWEQYNALDLAALGGKVVRPGTPRGPILSSAFPIGKAKRNVAFFCLTKTLLTTRTILSGDEARWM